LAGKAFQRKPAHRLIYGATGLRSSIHTAEHHTDALTTYAKTERLTDVPLRRKRCRVWTHAALVHRPCLVSRAITSSYSLRRTSTLVPADGFAGAPRTGRRVAALVVDRGSGESGTWLVVTQDPAPSAERPLGPAAAVADPGTMISEVQLERSGRRSFPAVPCCARS